MDAPYAGEPDAYYIGIDEIGADDTWLAEEVTGIWYTLGGQWVAVLSHGGLADTRERAALSAEACGAVERIVAMELALRPDHAPGAIL